MASTTTPLGEIKGTDHDGYERYAGIRYAKAPVGDRRFRAPEPVEAWDGVYDATAFGAQAPQAVGGFGAVGVAADMKPSEDCLFLNVYTPRADDRARPVMVWIHGGAYTMGSGDVYDGASFARNGDVVVVTLNYRLGILGWTPLDHLDPSLTGSGNNGLRDQIEALRWVQANISAFGGDPTNVTIFGESAGGGSVFALLAAPAADGLYSKAIVESGVPGFGIDDGARAYVDAVLAGMGDPDGGIDALRAASIDELVAGQNAAGLFDKMGLDENSRMDGAGGGPHPSIDGVVVTRSVVEAVRERGASHVPMIIGSNADEGTLFAMLLPRGLSPEQVRTAVPTWAGGGSPGRVLEAIAAAKTNHEPIVDLMTDGIFRIPSLHVADELATNGAPIWTYLFDWKTPVFGGMLGATHALELPFVWDMLDNPLWKMLLGDAPPAPVGEAMRTAWLNFARTGDPNGEGDGALPRWPQYDTTERPTMVFDEQVRVESDPGGELRAAWYGD